MQWVRGLTVLDSSLRGLDFSVQSLTMHVSTLEHKYVTPNGKGKKSKMILEIGSEANLFYFDPLSLQGCFA